MSLDRFLGRRRVPGYDCAALARDVWLHLTGVDLAGAAAGLLSAQHVGRIPKATRRGFRELPAPVAPCLVIMRRPGFSLHMGVYVGRGEVFHLGERGAILQRLEIATQLFKTVQFAACQ